MEPGDDLLSLWRHVQLVHLQVTYRLHRGLLDDVGIGYHDYVVLTELDPGPLRVTELATRAGLEKSRLSHQLDRLEKQGLVRRQPTSTDRRGAEVAVTAAGRRLQRRATPGHLERVQRLFGDHLTAAERRALASASAKILGALG